MGYHIHETLNLCNQLRETAEAGMEDFSRLIHICHYVLETQHLEGDMVEFGCHYGKTAALMASLTSRPIHLYDSFEGLPPEEGCVAGAMACKPEDVEMTFRWARLTIPTIHKGWFKDFTLADLPSKISLAHIDGDLYCSTMDALRLVYPKMTKYGYILIDDYQEPFFPGVERAVSEFLKDKPECAQILSGPNHSLSYKAVIRKLPE